jgi:hypothetical protein
MSSNWICKIKKRIRFIPINVRILNHHEPTTSNQALSFPTLAWLAARCTKPGRPQQRRQSDSSKNAPISSSLQLLAVGEVLLVAMFPSVQEQAVERMRFHLLCGSGSAVVIPPRADLSQAAKGVHKALKAKSTAVSRVFCLNCEKPGNHTHLGGW